MFKDYAKTPPCGWNSWDCYGAGVNEKQLLENAEYMAEKLLTYGWEYIVCDIQWYEPKAKGNDYNNFTELSMDEYGRLIPAENRFPSSVGGKGFKQIAGRCHELGLKFGIHILRGIPRQAVHLDTPIKNSSYTARQAAHHFSVCPWNTDMYGLYDNEAAQKYYDSIFELYASWGVDFVKCDDISVTEFRKWDTPYSAPHEIEMIRRAIDKCGREIVLSLSPGPTGFENAEHLCNHANMWRLTGDFWDSWDALYDVFNKCRTWQGISQYGNWPDCDMLPLGRLSKDGRCHGEQNRYTLFSKDEQLTMITLWGIFKSPLMFGGNLPENDEWTLSLLTNKEYMNMHRTCCNSRELYNTDGIIIWTASGMECKYIALFNTTQKTVDFKFDISLTAMPDTEYSTLDIWQNVLCENVKDSIAIKLQPHGCSLLKLSSTITA